MKKLLTIFLLTLLVWSASAQANGFVQRGDRLLRAYEETLSGIAYKYAYPMPGIEHALIIRGNGIGGVMEFTSEALPVDYSQKSALYILPIGMGSAGKTINLDLYIGGSKEFTFTTQAQESWTMDNSKGMTLSYENLMYDGSRDTRGILYLRIPTAQLTKGKALNIKIEAENANTLTWFMAFTDKIIPEVNLQLSPGIVVSKGVEKQTVFVNVVHFAPNEKATIKVDGNVLSKQTLKLGYNTLQIEVDRVVEPKEITVDVLMASGDVKRVITLMPTRDWQLNFVEHSHTDIGYTRPQTDILAEHIRYIDYALDYCDLTDNYPDAAKFRWTCESAWAVEEYLNTRPQSQIDRLKQRVKEGRIELTAMLYNFDEMPDETTLAASLKPIETFREENLGVEVAMQNDVNGIGWCFADYFADLGVKYLNMGTHGHRALICFDYPTLFRWQSPSGNEMIAYRAEHYMHGNNLGVEVDDFKNFEVKVLDYLSSLEAKGYPYDIAQLQCSGYTTDNSPPSTQACENIRKWNEKYKSPQLRMAVPSEFFKAAEAKYSDELPTYRAAWPDWWTDGFAAGAREAAVSRFVHTDIIAGLNGFGMAKILGSRIPKKTTERFDEALRTLLFYDEHTTGYSESVRAPYCRQTIDQRALKESYAWEANRRSRIVNEAMHGLLQEYVTKGDRQSIVIYNPSSVGRSGITKLYIDHEILPIQKKSVITDASGNVIKAQAVESRSDGTYWNIWAENVPALGSVQYFIEVLDQGSTRESYRMDETTPENITIDNEWYTITLDTKKGVISSIIDKDLGAEIIDQKAQYSMGEFILEKIADRAEIEAYTLKNYTRQPLDSVWYGGLQRGDIFDSYRFYGFTQTGIDFNNGSANFTFDIQVYHTDKRIGLGYSLYKAPIVEPESFYIAMPFELDDSKIFFEAQGGVVEAGVDQIPGSANDWNTVQNFSAVRNGNAQIVMVSQEIPLAQFGNINTGRYIAGATPESSHIYSWPMNNYWVTNFNADQRGQFNWSYVLTSQLSTKNSDATNFSLGVRVPLMGRVLPRDVMGKNSMGGTFGSVLNIGADNVMLVNMRADDTENEIVMQLRELDGVDTKLDITSHYINDFTLVECNVLGEEMGEFSGTVRAFDNVFVKLVW